MKTKVLFLSLVTAVTLCFSSCGASTEELAKEAQQSLIEANPGLKVTEDLMLVHESGNIYTGFMTGSYEGETGQIFVKVIYDGESFTAEMTDFN
jgi:hypothetical protein